MAFLDKIKQNLSNNSNNSYTNNQKNICVKFDSFPSSMQEIEVLAGDFKDPFMISALAVVALCMYSANKELCIEVLNFLKGPTDLSIYEKQFLRDRLVGKEYVPVSYFDGATPDNNYEPSEPLSITVFETGTSMDLIGEGYMQLYLKSGGADSMRAVRLRQKTSTGEWFLWEQYLLPDIRKPKKLDPFA